MLRFVFSAAFFIASVGAAERIEVDFGTKRPPFKALHGVNKGPLVAGGLIDLTPEFQAAGIPLVRLHDCHWPNPDVVDIHTLFKDWSADPSRPDSFTFGPTDEYLEAIRAAHAEIYFRLGESIEHTIRKKHVHPPRDPAKWAEVCLRIIRHYNHGWANGTQHNIRYWEIWNEPENRPAMWTGTDEEFFELYAITSKKIKSAYPGLKVGGPGVGHSGKFEGGRFVAGSFLTNFLQFCRRTSAPLDFLSWHCYADDPTELIQRARAIRQLLDQHGFDQAESHLNEWNYLPGNSWDALSKKALAIDRQRFYQRMGGTEGAAFTASALLLMQEAPVDRAMFFHGETGGFGLFNEYGVPNATYAAVVAFGELTRAEARPATHRIPSLNIGAAYDQAKHRGLLLLANTGAPRTLRIRLANIPRAWSKVEIRGAGEAGTRSLLIQNDSFELTIASQNVLIVHLKEN